MYEQLKDEETELNVETTNLSADVADVHSARKGPTCSFVNFTNASSKHSEIRFDPSQI